MKALLVQINRDDRMSSAKQSINNKVGLGHEVMGFVDEVLGGFKGLSVNFIWVIGLIDKGTPILWRA